MIADQSSSFLVPQPSPASTRASLGDVARIGRYQHAVAVAFDADSERSWLELVRDIVAVANSGGGVILVDVRRGNSLAGRDNGPLDGPGVRAMLRRYTGETFDGIKFKTMDDHDLTVVAVTVPAASVPIGFVTAGVLAGSSGSAEQHVVFNAGTFYFRHGEASEPGTADDMRKFFRARVRRLRHECLRGIRRVLADPDFMIDRDTIKLAATSQGSAEAANLQPVRIVTDPTAPALQPQDVERLFPWRQKELVRELNRRLAVRRLNSYDIQAVRRHHRLDERPDFVFNLPGAGRRYSDAAADWFAEEYARNPAFFDEARAADQETLRLRRQKPR